MYGSVVTYTCSHGYEPYGGDTTLMCDDTGVWFGNSLECSLIGNQTWAKEKKY